MLWLKKWETYPSNEIIFVETVRIGCGESRHIVDAPGHIFEIGEFDGRNYESGMLQDNPKNAVLSGFILLIMCFDWDVYILSKSSLDYIYLGDQRILFSSINKDKIQEAETLLHKFNLAVKFKS